jgi:hypothetical protein
MQWMPTEYIGQKIAGRVVKVRLVNGPILGVTNDSDVILLGIADCVVPVDEDDRDSLNAHDKTG